MRVYGVQFDIAWEDKAANRARARALVEAARPGPGSLIVLPEMFSTGFSMNVAGIHEGAGRETEAFLAELARSTRSTLLAGVVTRGGDGRGRNEAVAFGPDGAVRARYAKIHPFTFGGETAHYAAGTRIVQFDWSGVRVCPFICFDLRFPEVFREAVREGAQLYAVIASWPDRREGHWMDLLRARAIENQAYVIGVNRCGKDPSLSYSGRSQVIDPKGEVIADAGSGEGVVQAEIDLPGLLDYRAALPFLKDMKPRGGEAR